MAGHSKWKNIRLRKGKQDAIRGNLFTKLSREIIVAARGGGDPSMNARLRVAVEKAREASMPVENIKRAIARGTGEVEGAAYEEIVYEGKGPGGAGLILECYSENRNRTVAEVRHAFNKHGGAMGENGSVAWQFNRVGYFTLPLDGQDPDELELTVIDQGAEDVESDGETLTVYTAMGDLYKVVSAIEAAGLKPADVELIYRPTNKADLTPDDQNTLVRLIDALDELDDVQRVHVNVDIDEDALDQD